MTTAVLSKAYQVLNLTTDISSSINQAQGQLSNRKIIPIPFYLLVGTSMVGLSCTVALALTTMWVVTSVFALFTLIQIAAAISVYKSATTQELNEVVDHLSDKVAALFKLNQDIKNEVNKVEETGIAIDQNIIDYEKLNEDFQKENADLKKELIESTQELEKVKDAVVVFAKKHTADKELLRKHLDEITGFLKGSKEDVSGLEKMRTEIHAMDVTKAQFVEIEACLLKQDEENRHMFDEIIKILEIVKRSTQEYDDDIERLKEENTILSLQVDKMTALYKKIQVDLKKQQKILEKREEQLKKLESLFNALQSESKTTT